MVQKASLMLTIHVNIIDKRKFYVHTMNRVINFVSNYFSIKSDTDTSSVQLQYFTCNYLLTDCSIPIRFLLCPSESDPFAARFIWLVNRRENYHLLWKIGRNQWPHNVTLVTRREVISYDAIEPYIWIPNCQIDRDW